MEDKQNSYDPYDMSQYEEERKPPVIKFNHTERQKQDIDNTFIKALATMHKIDVNKIKVEIQGHRKLYKINDKIIFTDNA
jgi:hypothetical protein